MKGFIRLMILGALVGSLVSCVSQQSEEDDSLTTKSYAPGDESAAAADTGGEKDEFADFDKSDSSAATEPAAPADASAANEAPPPAADQDLSLENEVNQAAGTDPQLGADDLDKQASNALQPDAPVEDPALAPVAQDPPPPAVEDTAMNPVPEAAPVPETPAPTVSAEKPVEITGLKYKANDAGGTVVIESAAPVTFTTRANPELKQYVIEISNAVLPKKLKRSLNTKDIKGAVGAVDAYQAAGSQVARIVVQMRDGFADPTIQQEGNSLLVITSGGEAGAAAAGQVASADSGGGSPSGGASSDSGDGEELTKGGMDPQMDLSSKNILASQSLQEYLSGNTKFYGRKISIETSNIDVRDALKFITEESGVNMVITDDVKGNVSLKLRQVPWDQALVMIMKARKLGYSRQGNVLRIVPLDDLKKEEDDATKMAIAKRNIEPMKVRAFTISYAKVDDLDKKIKDFLTERGKVVSDARTNTVVVTDIPDSLARVAKLLEGLDSAPPQVLIEGKIVEASDAFTRSVGVNWGFSGADKVVGGGAQGPINMRPNLNVGAGNRNTGGLDLGINVGTLDIFGDLAASLNLYEKEEKVKVLSSPRIVTLSNETANISQTNELPVKVVTTPATGAPTTSYQFKPLTLKLEVTPQITHEGTIIMKVSVNRQIKGPAVSTTDDTFSVNSREANTRVIVKNGQTAVIGGIYRTDVTEGVTGVPWLKDIPVLGYLFKAQTTDRQRSELLIFLTPRILAQTETTSANNQEAPHEPE
jgi:type IV pilus assembly protein PilQ